MVNIKDVANKAGVSASTVSRVLSGHIPVARKTKEKVLAAINEMNYQPNVLAQSLKGARIKMLGLIIPDVRSLVFPAAIRGIEDTAMKYGYTVVLCNTDEDVKKEYLYIEALKRRSVDGFIFSTARPGHEEIFGLKEEGMPVVSLIRHVSDTVDAVVLDNFSGAYQATNYMISRGLKNIAIINGNMDIVLYQERFAGYQQALAQAGLSLSPELVVQDIYGWEDGYQAMSDMLNKGLRPDAVFAASDPKAIGIMKAIKDFGMTIPDDISVMGFDNFDWAPLMDPPLTTVAQPFYDMGVAACQRLIQLIEAKSKMQPKIQVLPAELVIRKSVR